jgi:hypothetical protein
MVPAVPMVPAYRDAAANVFTHPSPVGYRPVAMIGWHVPCGQDIASSPHPELRFPAYDRPGPEVSRAGNVTTSY